VDLQGEVDLIEEVVRVQGYERLPTTLPGITQAGGVVPTYALRRRACEGLVQAGLRESLSLSFASEADLALIAIEPAHALRVKNPPTAEEPFLRPRLMPNLLKAVRRNVSRGVDGVALFEVGHVFWDQAEVVEREHAAAALTGAGTSWPDAPRAFDFFDGKGALQSLLEGLGAEGWSLGEPAGWPLHPGRSARVLVGETEVGVLGDLHPRAAADFEVPARTVVLEVDLSVLAPLLRTSFSVREVPRFPPVRRDLAFIVDAGVPAGAMLAALEEAGGSTVESAALFDLHTGPPIPAGRKSLAFSVVFRAPDRTLTDAEAERAVSAIVARLAEAFGAELRSG
jgi:phenylalanyl-tRNA synthetase beta chain